MIAALTDEKGEAKAPDLALRLGVSTATVVKALAHLRERDLVFEEEGRIGLTGNGWKQAEDTERRLRAMEAFLLSLGVSERTARSDATRLAPLASEETVRAMARFLARKMG
jgi:DtxR family manganese transport transcriptional regulator